MDGWMDGWMDAWTDKMYMYIQTDSAYSLAAREPQSDADSHSGFGSESWTMSSNKDDVVASAAVMWCL